MKTKGLAQQIKVTLKGIEPEVWRRIVVPAGYSFWDLHVAIQDSMGRLDCHLHAFRVRNPDTGKPDQIGIPDDDAFEDDEPFLRGWEIPMVEYFRQPGDRADYDYDFGDGWEHEVLLEEVTVRVPKAKYPICLDGAGACPPEDCGGVSGYEEMLKVLCDPTHEDHESTLLWVGGNYDPAAFDPKKVRFESPKKRWRIAFDGLPPGAATRSIHSAKGTYPCRARRRLGGGIPGGSAADLRSARRVGWPAIDRKLSHGLRVIFQES